MKIKIELDIESKDRLLDLDVVARLIRHLQGQPIGYEDASLARDVFFTCDVTKIQALE